MYAVPFHHQLYMSKHAIIMPPNVIPEGLNFFTHELSFTASKNATIRQGIGSATSNLAWHRN